MPHLKVFKHFVLLQQPNKCKFIVIFWFSKNKGKTWIRDQEIVSYQKYYIGNFLSKAYFGFTGFTQNIFLNLACVLSFTPKSKLLRMWLSWTLCVLIFFLLKQGKISLWNSILPSLQSQNGVELKIIGPPTIFIEI